MSGPDYESLPLEDHVTRAEYLATVVHAGQVDKVGRGYFSHLNETYRATLVRGSAAGLSHEEYQTALIVAWLHDSVEDTPVTLTHLVEFGFPARAVSLIGLMTRRKGQTPQQYYGALKREPEGRVVKAADMDSNTSPGRMARLDPGTQIRLLGKYAKGYELLEMEPRWPLDKMLERAEQAKAEASA